MMVGPTVEMRMLHKLLVNKDNKRLVLIEEAPPVEEDLVLEVVVEADPLLVYIVIFVVAVSKPIAVFNTQMAQKSTVTNGLIRNVNKLVVVATASSVHQDKTAAQVKALSNVPMVAVAQPVKRQPLPQPLPARQSLRAPNVPVIKKNVPT